MIRGYNCSNIFEAAATNDCQEIEMFLNLGVDVNAKNSKGQTALMHAVYHNQIDAANTLLYHGADINLPSGKGNTPLMAACDDGAWAMAKLLIERGADIHAQNKGWTALLKACNEGNVETVKVLLNNGANIGDTLPSGHSAMYLAIKKYHPNIAKLLLDNGAEITPDLISKDQFGRTLLFSLLNHYYSNDEETKDANTEIAKCLIEHGVDVGAVDEGTGMTALYLAAQSGYTEIAQILLDKGVDKNARIGDTDFAKQILEIMNKPSSKDFSHWDFYEYLKNKNPILIEKYHLSFDDATDIFYILEKENGKDAMTEAIEFENTDVIKILQNNGATVGTASARHKKVSKKENQISFSKEELTEKLASALGKKNLTDRDAEYAKTLINLGADPNATYRYNEKLTEKLVSVLGRENLTDSDAEYAKTLINLGVDPNAMATPPNKKHAEPILVLALRRKLPEVANLLIDNGADPNATSRDNESAIYLALKAGRNDVAKNLLDHGADPNLLNCDYEDYTNFQFACLISRSDEELMQKFLDHGADINANTKSGVTLLDEATLCGPQDLIQFLIDHGANVNAKNNVNGEAPILDAARNGYTGVVKFLLDSGADIEATTSSGETPLILAIENSYLDTAKYLVARGANINAVASNNEIIQMFYEKDTGRWPTQQGISYGSVRPLAKTRMQPKEWIKAHYEGLLNGKPVDNKDLVFGKTTLAIAIDKAIEYEFDNNTVYSCRDYYDFARSLIESGANVNVLAIDGNPLIMETYEAWSGLNHSDKARKLVFLMLKKGANVNVTQFRRQRFYYALDADRTPLMKAIEYEDTEFFDQVIARGANLEAKDLYGRTALMQACNSYRDVFAIKLANLGANAKARDNVGATPMMYIRGLPKKYTELINALQAHGADINDVDNYQRNIFERIMEDSYFWTREHDFLWSLDKWALQWAKMGVDADVVGHSTFSEYHWVLDKYPALKDVIFWDNWNKQQAQKDKKPAAADADSDDENGNGCQ